jgi:carboxymethylenebutenolidase
MAELETIQTGDSTVRAYIRIPDAARAGVVVLHAWWGLNDDVISYADRLVAEGYAIVAPDMFDGKVATEIEDADRLSGTMDEEAGKAITLAAVDRLAERLPADAPLAALGFSLGAAWGVWAPIERDRVAATVV